ncbi:MAG: hypothetical protein AAF628_11945 [Planctomycetota bacterium]
MTAIRASWLAALAVAAGATAQVEAPPAPDPTRRVVVTVEAPAVGVPLFVGQRLRVSVRLAIEREFGQRFLVARSRQPLDVPVRLAVPWLEARPGLSVRPVAPGPAVERRTVAVNGAPAIAAAAGEVAGRDAGRRALVYRFDYDLVATAPGSVALAPVQARFDYATRFATVPFRDPVPEAPTAAQVQSGAALLKVRALPAVGRPPGFAGAVGSFALQVEARPPAVAVGDTVEVVVTLRGGGDLQGVVLPDLPLVGAAHVLGSIELAAAPLPRSTIAGEAVRQVRYDVLPLQAGRWTMPPVQLSYFDPAPPGTYRVATTQPWSLEVGPGTRPAAAAALPEAEERPVLALLPIAAGSPAASGVARSPAMLASLILGPWLLAGVTWAAARRRRRRDPVLVRTKRAARAFRRARRRGVASPEALAAFVAARLGVPTAGAVAPDLAARLISTGTTPERAEHAAAVLRGLVGSRYGGPSLADDADAAAAGVVAALVRPARGAP